MLKSLSLFLLSLFILACSTMDGPGLEPLETMSDIDTIRYGSFFGECMGYCTEELIVTSDSIVRIKDNLWDDAVIPDTQRMVHSEKTWDSLCTLVDNQFFALDSTIGCPDCVDGGGEWFEVTLKSGKQHKTTFEFGSAPVEIKAVTEHFRNLFVLYD